MNKKRLMKQMNDKAADLVMPAFFSQAALVAFLHEKKVIDANEFIDLYKANLNDLFSDPGARELATIGIDLISNLLESWEVDDEQE